MPSLQEYKSFLRWISILILSFASKLGSFYTDFINSFLICTVEIWGPKRYSSTKLDAETSYGDSFHKDRLYLRLLDYLSTSNSDFYSPSNANFQRHVSADNYYKYKEGSSPVTNTKKPITLGPQNDHPHCIQFKGEWLTIERSQIPEVHEEEYPYEKVKITSKRKNRSLIYELLDTVVKSTVKDNSGQNSVQIHKPKEDPCTCCVSSWEEMGGPRHGRPLDSVILADGIKKKLVNDFKEFLSSKDWYEQREIPFVRGYLLYGPPGSGKSSLVKALASQFNLDICLLTFTSKRLNDFTLSRHINSGPEKSIILIEDIDAAFKSRDDEFAESSDKNLSFGGATCSSTVTFSGLLNALDGVVVGGTADPRIIIMTTNHIEKLDPALIRPGRIDMKILIDYPTDNQIKLLYKRFYSELGGDGDDAEDFLKCVRSCCGDVKMTMAMVQGLLMDNRQEDMTEVKWYKAAKKYFKDQVCPHQNKKHNQFGLYV